MSKLTSEIVFKDVSIDIIESVIESYNYALATPATIHNIINEIDSILYKIFNPQIIDKEFVKNEIRRCFVECMNSLQSKYFILGVVDGVLEWR